MNKYVIMHLLAVSKALSAKVRYFLRNPWQGDIMSLLWCGCSLTSPNPPFPSSLYCLNACLVMGCLEEKHQDQFFRFWAKLWAECGAEPTEIAAEWIEYRQINQLPGLSVARRVFTRTDLSIDFHWRKRSKNMLSWYWMKVSPLRYLCRSLIHETVGEVSHC